MRTATSIRKYEKTKFEYGTLDCFLFVCNVVRDMTGTDYAKPYRGKYQSEFGALRQIAAFGDFEKSMKGIFGEMKPAWTMKSGSPVLLASQAVDNDRVAGAIGIYDGKDIVCLASSELLRLPVTAGKGCWHV